MCLDRPDHLQSSGNEEQQKKSLRKKPEKLRCSGFFWRFPRSLFPPQDKFIHSSNLVHNESHLLAQCSLHGPKEQNNLGSRDLTVWQNENTPLSWIQKFALLNKGHLCFSGCSYRTCNIRLNTWEITKQELRSWLTRSSEQETCLFICQQNEQSILMAITLTAKDALLQQGKRN